ncbi:DUF4832 domain-containing protein [Brevibacillus choshinensis]|uniref:DUF4832 domain-containing protein n=1 Tax=Brevibacillus choshinensis TaxID=54911 RepID=UPI002E20649A|nr:DUF4832 domain-containing protein [Brevibacillus choshinensis]
MRTNWRLITLALTLLLTSLPALSEGAGKKMVTYEPVPIEDVLLNPYMGLAPDARNESYDQEHTLVYANISWRMLEPEKGDYQFEQVEKELHLDQWADKGAKFIIRIIMDYPEEKTHLNIPDWLYRELNGDGEWYENSYGKGFSPNYGNPLLISYHQKLIEHLGEHYKNDPRLAFVELGSIGHWGEWHTNTSIPFPKLAITDQYVQPYLDHFPDSILMMRRPHPIAKKYRLGLFNDVFGNKEQTAEYKSWFDKGYVSWLTQEKMPAMPDFWKVAPSGGEFSPSKPLKRYFSASSIDDMIAQAQSSHLSWLGPNTPAAFPAKGAQQKYLNRFLNTLGYRFAVNKETHEQEVVAGSRLDVHMEVANKGIAPFYFPWVLELSLADAAGNIVSKTATTEDIRKWLPGKAVSTPTLEIPTDLPAGEYTICIAILDPQTEEPGIQWAMGGKREDLRYQLGKVEVPTP